MPQRAVVRERRQAMRRRGRLMPGPALHHMIADRLRARIAASNGLGPTLPASDYAQLDALLGDPATCRTSTSGCQGPDFLFFNTNDVSPTAQETSSRRTSTSTTSSRTSSATLKDIVPQPVLDALAAFDEAANAVVTSSSTLTELRKLFDDMQQVVDGLLATLLEAVKAWVSEFNLFDLVSHPYRDGVPGGTQAGRLLGARRPRRGDERVVVVRRDALPQDRQVREEAAREDDTRLAAPPLRDRLPHARRPPTRSATRTSTRSPAARTARTRSATRRARTTRTPSTSSTSAASTGTARRSTRSTTSTSAGTIDTENDEPDPFTNLPPALAALITDALNEIYDEDGAPPTPDYAKPITRERHRRHLPALVPLVQERHRHGDAAAHRCRTR